MTAVHDTNRALLNEYRRSLYDWDDAAARGALETLCTPDAVFHHCHPFGDLAGPQAFFDAALKTLRDAWPDVERRDWIVMAGEDEHGADWVGCGGHYIGTFAGPFLDIPPTGHLTHMRFHEFYRIVDGRVAEMQAIWDLPEAMMQAGAWPMAPSLGAEVMVPGPASGDGLVRGPRDAGESEASRQIIVDMLNHMKRHPARRGGRGDGDAAVLA